MREAEMDRWPPPVAHEWTLERARAEDVMIYGIGLETEFFNGQTVVRSKPNSILNRFANETGGGFFNLKKDADLGAIVNPDHMSQAGVEFTETPLSEAIAFLAETHQINIWLDRAALEEADVPADLPITLRLSGSTSIIVATRLAAPSTGSPGRMPRAEPCAQRWPSSSQSIKSQRQWIASRCTSCTRQVRSAGM